MSFPLIALANDVDIPAWCAWAGPQAWRNKRGAVEILVRYRPQTPRPFLLAVRTNAQHVHAKDVYVQPWCGCTPNCLKTGASRPAYRASTNAERR